VLFDIKKEYNRSLPHYEESLAIKNALSGLGARDATSLLAPVVVSPSDNDALVLQSLDENIDLAEITKATLSTAMTHQKLASVYAKVRVFLVALSVETTVSYYFLSTLKQKKWYDLSLFHYCRALKIRKCFCVDQLCL
jgi:hypothetical protein